MLTEQEAEKIARETLDKAGRAAQQRDGLLARAEAAEALLRRWMTAPVPLEVSIRANWRTCGYSDCGHYVCDTLRLLDVVAREKEETT